MSDLQFNRTPFLVAGTIGFLVCIIQIALGFAVWTYFSNLKIGAFWISLPGFIAYILCFFTTTKPMAAIVATFTTIGYLMGFVGCIVDGIAAAVIVGIQVCGGGDSFSPTITSVSATAQVDILSCIIQNTGNDIVCTDANNCYFYNGHGTDPSIVQGQYLSLVRACTAFDVILTVVLFFTALLAYAAICCPQCLGSVPAVVNQQKNTVIVVQGVHEEPSPVATVYDPSTGKVINDGV